MSMTSLCLNNRYRIVETLGRGGFGETFLAEDEHLPSRRRCVIKQLRAPRPELLALVQERFAKEAMILERLGTDQGQIPQLYAYFVEDQACFLVQEWIEGPTLRQWYQEQGGLVSPIQVCQLLMQLLVVLQYVHGQGIVHRDIKPDNVILRRSDGQPVLIDFGAVKDAVHPGETPSTSIVIGTPGFMAPEQAIGHPTYASDLYSVGMVGLYLLTGKMPQELPRHSETGEVTWQDWAIPGAQALVPILQQAIRMAARERFPSAAAMVQALDGVHVSMETALMAPKGLGAWVESLPTLPPSVMPTVVTGQPVPSTQGENRSPHTWIGMVVMMAIASVGGMTISYSQQWFKTQLPRVGSLSQPVAEVSTPELTVQEYYSLLNQRKYGQAWQLFSLDMRTNPRLHPEGFKSYLVWWSTVDQIRLLDSQVVEETDNEAAVDLHLYLVLRSGKEEEQRLRFYLAKEQQQWQITQVKLLPASPNPS